MKTRTIARLVTLVLLALISVGYVWRISSISNGNWDVEAFSGGQLPPEEEPVLIEQEQVATSTPTSNPTPTPRPSPTPKPTATPTNTPTPTWTPLVVARGPEYKDVFAAATAVVVSTQQAEQYGTPTPLPPNAVTATATRPPFVIRPTRTPMNEATATLLVLLAEAQAVTTGTPTPIPPGAVTATPVPTRTPRPTPIPQPTSTPRPTATNRPPPTATPSPTPTPVLIYLSDAETLSHYVRPTSTPVATPATIPSILREKILFKSDRLGWERVFVMDTDGGNVALLTNSWPYEVTLAREPVSSEGVIVYQAQGRHGLDLFLHDPRAGVHMQLTWVGIGVCYDMAWSPDNAHIAFTSNQDGSDEIFVVTPGGPTRQLTHGFNGEWHKHPSFSPDGQQITYWSNTGTSRKQIWVMNADGSNKHNISNSPYNDWDPVWVK